MKIAIAGGGISGLATAFYIKQKNPNIEITLFEQDDQLGGKMKTKRCMVFCLKREAMAFCQTSQTPWNL